MGPQKQLREDTMEYCCFPPSIEEGREEEKSYWGKRFVCACVCDESVEKKKWKDRKEIVNFFLEMEKKKRECGEVKWKSV